MSGAVDAASLHGPPAEVIARIDARARRVATPCGDGDMIWRVWGEGPPLVLLHGNFGTWMHWIRNIGPLSRGHTVIAVDTPGFGESAMPPPTTGARDVGEIVARGLKLVIPDGCKAHLVGFSYGGRIAGEVAALAPGLLESLVLVAPGGFGAGDSAPPGIRKLRPRMTPDEVADVHRVNLQIVMIADPAKADDLAVHIQDANTRRARYRMAAWPAAEQLSSLANVLPEIRVPVNGIWSDRDAFAEHTLEQRIGTLRSTHPDAEIRILEGAGHWLQYEAPAAFNALLVELLG